MRCNSAGNRALRKRTSKQRTYITNNKSYTGCFISEEGLLTLITLYTSHILYMSGYSNFQIVPKTAVTNVKYLMSYLGTSMSHFAVIVASSLSFGYRSNDLYYAPTRTSKFRRVVRHSKLATAITENHCSHACSIHTIPPLPTHTHLC